MTRADRRYVKNARKGYTEIVNDFQFKKKMIAQAVERLLTPEEAQAKIDAGQNPLQA